MAHTLPWRSVLEDLRTHPTDESVVWEAVRHQLAEHAWDGPSMVYLMHTMFGRRRWVKIGQTMQSAEIRRREIERSTKCSVTVMACLSASTRLETSLHAIFAPWHASALAGVGAGVGAPSVRAPSVRAPSVRAPSVRAPSVRAPSGVEWFEHTSILSRLARTMNAMQAIIGRPTGSSIWAPEEVDVEVARALLTGPTNKKP